MSKSTDRIVQNIADRIVDNSFTIEDLEYLKEIINQQIKQENSKIKVGDIVYITHIGFMYSTYTTMFEKFKFKNLHSNYPIPGREGFPWKVIGMAPHDTDSVTVCALENLHGEQVVIEIRGIKKEIIG